MGEPGRNQGAGGVAGVVAGGGCDAGVAGDFMIAMVRLRRVAMT